MEAWIITYIGIPLLIICARIIDVSIGTIRVIFIARGLKKWAPILGFFEVLVWIIVIKNVVNNISHWSGYVAYATGFALGTYLGMVLEEKLIHGKVILRIILRKHPSILIEELGKNWPLTVMNGSGPHGPVKVILLIVDRKEIPTIINTVKIHNPNAFYSIEEVKYASEIPELSVRKIKQPMSYFPFRKGK